MIVGVVSVGLIGFVTGLMVADLVHTSDRPYSSLPRPGQPQDQSR